MICPNCGLSLSDMHAQVCPRCGHPLQVGATHIPDYGYAGPPQDAPGISVSDYSAQPPMQHDMPAYGQAAPPSYPFPSYPPYGPQGMLPAYPPGYPPYEHSGPYGQSAPVTTPFYGQAAPPSYPMYAPPPGAYSPPGWQNAPFQPQPKRGNALAIGLTIGIVAVILLASIGAIAAVRNARDNAARIAAATPTATATATASVQKILFQDTLTSDINGWSNDDHCFFATDGYHIRNNWQCYAPAGVMTDFDLTVQVKQISGPLNYPYGIVFRHPSSGSEYYFFITSDSHWRMSKCVGTTCSPLIGWSSAPTLGGGLNITHTLEVRANGSHISVAADGEQLGSTDDTTLSSGLVGLVTEGATETVFTDIKITTV